MNAQLETEQPQKRCQIGHSVIAFLCPICINAFILLLSWQSNWIASAIYLSIAIFVMPPLYFIVGLLMFFLGSSDVRRSGMIVIAGSLAACLLTYFVASRIVTG